MRIINGSTAFSPFRLDKLLHKVRGHCPAVTALAAHYTYLVELTAPLDPNAGALLERLLTKPRGTSTTGCPFWQATSW